MNKETVKILTELSYITNFSLKSIKREYNKLPHNKREQYKVEMKRLIEDRKEK